MKNSDKFKSVFGLYATELWAMTGRMAYWKVVAWIPLPEPYKEGEQDD